MRDISRPRLDGHRGVIDPGLIDPMRARVRSDDEVHEPFFGTTRANDVGRDGNAVLIFGTVLRGVGDIDWSGERYKLSVHAYEARGAVGDDPTPRHGPSRPLSQKTGEVCCSECACTPFVEGSRP